MQQPTRRPSGTSVLRRYAPILAIALVVGVLVAVFAFVGGDDESDAPSGSATTEAGATSAVPIIYPEAVASGTVDDYDWGDRCDRESGLVAIPNLGAAPCVPVFTGDNGGATSPGVTAEKIRIAFYISPPDPQTEALVKLAGAYDEPEDVQTTLRQYVEIYQGSYELYGREVELIPLEGSGIDDAAARADAIRAAEELDVFAVLGGPLQGKAFAEELAAHEVLCLGACLGAQPESFYRENSPYVWAPGPSPEQTAAFVTELIAKQLLGGVAEYAGDPDMHATPRVFGLLSYDTPDGTFATAWENFKEMLADSGIDLATHVTYFLDLAKAQEDSRTVVTKLKNAGVTSVIFTGDPIMPRYFTEEATAQGFFPEWVIAGTVYADTDVFGRTFDQEQWAHAFGVSLIPTRVEKENDASTRLYEWWFGDGALPPAENTYGIVAGSTNLLFNALQAAGPDLNPESFRDGVYRLPIQEQGPGGLRTILTYGDRGIWPGDGYVDVSGLDNAGILWWDPEATGVDETGAEGTGMYRHVDGGRRYLPGEMPTEPIPFFDPTDAVTTYPDTPDELRPPEYPPPANRG